MELRKKSNEYAKLSSSINSHAFTTNQSRKNIERALRFILIIEFWMEQGDNDKAYDALQDLKKVIESNLNN